MLSKDAPKQSGLVALLVALFIAETTVTFEGAMVYAALPTLTRQFGDPLTVGWLVTVHLLIAAATAPVAGRLGDIHGRKKLILILMAIALAGSILSAVTTMYPLVLLGRAMQGISAAVLPLAIGVVRESLSESRVPLAIGLLTTAQGVGAASGLVIGGAIVDNFDWQWLFGASAILLVISLVAVFLFVPAKPGTPTRYAIDWFEGLLPIPGIASILLAISLTKQAGWLAPQVIGLFALALVIMAWWARRSLSNPEPFIDLRLFTLRNFAVANCIQITLGMGTMQIIYVFAAYMQSPAWTMVGLGLTATIAGLVKLPSNFLAFFAGPLSGWMTLRLGHRLTVMIGALMAASGWLVALFLPGEVYQVVLILCVIAFGTTILQAAIPNVVVQAVPQQRTSEAIGSMSVVRGIAGTIGAQVIALLLATYTMTSPDGGSQFPTAEAFRVTMAAMAGLTIVGALLALLLRSGPEPVAARELPA